MLERPKSRLEIRDDNWAGESSKGQGLLAAKMNRHKINLHARVSSLKVDAKGVAHYTRSNKEDYCSTTAGAIHRGVYEDPKKLCIG